MKARREIVGLPLICIKEGMVCGKIRDLLIDYTNGKVHSLIIEDEEWYLGAKLLSFDKVLGLGHDAVITESRENVLPFAQIKKAQDLIKQGIGVIGARVYTQKGEYIGNVEEYYFNEEDGSIVKCQLTGETQKRFDVDAAQIVTYGKGILIVHGDTGEMVTSVSRSLSQEALQDVNEADDGQPQDKAAALFEQKQRRFLLGKKVTKQILSEEGALLASEGDIVTDELIDKIKAGGKLVELTMNIEAV